MRLINTQTLELHEFIESQIPEYAILSHTWGTEEVTLQDWLYSRKQNPPRWGWVYSEDEVRKITAQKGYVKISSACNQARKNGYLWLWADTNCIDKTNSAELSEAINSMFNWYKKAEVCYAFLEDVPPCSPAECAVQESNFRSSRWFKRGWTLQELIAPRRLIFFSDSWTRIGKKSDEDIRNTIEQITAIPGYVLKDPWDLARNRPSIANIMSWASTRKTTRVEDTAYCLMGLFDINMPLLYGEGSKAFLRLQLEIIQQTSDLTFLAWNYQGLLKKGVLWFATAGTLAQDPRYFDLSGDSSKRDDFSRFQGWSRSLRIDNLGLTLTLPLVQTLLPNFFFAVLPFKQNRRPSWMPLVNIDGKYSRLGFPSITLTVRSMKNTPNEQEITLPIRVPRLFSILTSPKQKRSLQKFWKLSPINVLLTFPSGIHGIRHSEFRMYPDTRYTKNLLEETMLYLCINDDQPHIAYGAIKFWVHLDKEKRELAIFVAAELESVKTPYPKRWTCIDISEVSKSPQARGSEGLNLEQRARDTVSALNRGLLAWSLECDLGSKTSVITPGTVLLDDTFHEFSNIRAESGEGMEKRSNTADNKPMDLFIMAQIILPKWKKHV